MSQHKSVFYSDDQKRWRRIKTIFRLLAVIVIIQLGIAGLAIYWDSNTQLPRLHEEQEINTNLHQGPMAQNKPTKEFEKLKVELEKRIQKRKQDQLEKTQHSRNLVGKSNLTQQNVRGGFFVNWDAQSYYTLRDHINDMNTVFPEWFFVPDQGDTVATDIDERALRLMKSHPVAIIPMVSNYFSEKWNGANVQRILRSPASRHTYIQSLFNLVVKNQFQGVNIDFENLENMKTDENLLAFMQELYQTFHSHGLIVSQDIAPFNEDYNFTELAKCNDWLILMAYDQHASESAPGPVGEQSWVEEAIAQALDKIPAQKLVVGLAAYGYDWPSQGNGKDITYEEAIVTAKENQSEIIFDTTTNGLRFEYKDDNLGVHQVHFVDAMSNFNTMRGATDLGTSNFAVWRLGSEDPRLWTFFRRDLSRDSLKLNPFDFSKLSTIVPIGSNVDFEGEGEVLDVVATPSQGKAQFEVDSVDFSINEENYQVLPSGYLIRKFGGKPNKKIILTFDDGPDETWTPQILDILERENVPAAFFVIGVNAENNLPLLERMYDDGFEIGDHSFSHHNLAMVSRERAILEINATRRLIESVTGHSTIMFRPPYNADAEPENAQELIPVEIGKSLHMLTIGESIDPLDWEEGVSVDSILARVKAQEGLGNMILLHDAGGNRKATVEALPQIIAYYKSKGYTFTNIAGLLNKKRDDLMPPLADPTDRWLAYINGYLSKALYWLEMGLFGLFFASILLSIARMLFIGILAYIQKRRQNREVVNLKKPESYPKVSIIVPAYNEEVNAVRTVERLLGSDYPNLEVLFVDDGSKDQTFERVKNAFEFDPRTTLLQKENGGKASALNFGISHAQGDIVVCIDADTVLAKNAIRRLIEHFIDPDVGAVAGNVKVGNEKGILTLWQSVEYISSQNFDRRAFDMLNCISVIPGAIGAFRKEAIEDAGGFTTDTLAEDCDLTIRLLKLNWKVRYNSRALAMTEAPETLNMFLKQRFRWSFGILQCFWKHKDALCNPEYKALAWVAMPNMLVFQLLLPLLAPAADVIMIFAILTGHGLHMLYYFLLYLGIETLSAAVAFRFEREPLGRLWVIALQRFIYRYLMYWALLQSMISALRGEHRGWGALKRTGNVKADA